MKNKVAVAIGSPLLAVVMGIFINFPNFLIGNQATVLNLIVTAAYILIWIFAISIAWQLKNRLLMISFAAFWLTTLFFGVLTIFVSMVEFDTSWALIFVGLLLPQWYGIELFTDDFLISAVIISAISLMIFIGTVSSFFRKVNP
ncbi:hypothetical protein [Planococcus halotolerans]|uniref:Uncharacterized protein n=1 Tax=Planococcus halotolerans TaxID=2233542 RepID=A0A365KXF7_9BACL|nr:hypothetical protein [Planococcus halotolerans]QHJ69127.1 hypothetical protein DNR44_000050 [Planococcus halotolerans]RAZ77673.1 hypothetical protein DP120_09320 [Planococcus halotolerans]